MPVVGIKDCRGRTPKSGIPVRLPPQNICDVNPYVCRMTPASIDFKSEPPYVGRLSFEPHPRGCQCCSKVAQNERESYQRSRQVSQLYQPDPSRDSQTYQTPARASLGFSPRREPSVPTETRKRSYQEVPPSPEQNGACPQPTPSRISQQQAPARMSQTAPSRMSQQLATTPEPQPGRPSVQLTKKQKKMEAKRQKKLSDMERKREKRLRQQQKKKSRKTLDLEQVRLLREQRRRDDFVTACCTGLLLTPCVSAGSCSEEPDEREQANFYIQCKCCPAKRNPCEHKEPNLCETKRSRKQADFPCNCRNCKYQNKGCTNPRTGCLLEDNAESPVCYCTDEEKKDNRPHRVCDEEPLTRGAKTGQRGFYPQREGGVCDEMMMTNAALLTCTKQDGDACTKMVMTAELMQDMLIKQAQQGIQLANSLLTNRRFQLVDVTIPDQNIPIQVDGYRSRRIQTGLNQRSQIMQTLGSSKSKQPVELNNPNLSCYLENINMNDAILSTDEQNPLAEPLPRPPLNAYQSEPRQEDYKDVNTQQYQSPQFQQVEDPNRTISYHWSVGSAKQPTGVPNVPSNASNKVNPWGEQQQQYRQPGQYMSSQHQQPEDPNRTRSYVGSTGSTKISKGLNNVPSNQSTKLRGDQYPEQFRRPEERGQGHQASYQFTEPAQQAMGAPGVTGHICIPRDALLQDTTNPKLCIPLSFDPRQSTGWENCPFTSDHNGVPMVPEPDLAASSAQRVLQKAESRQLAPGSQHSMKYGSQHGLPTGKQQSLQSGLQKYGSKQGLMEGSRPGVHKQDSRSALQRESSKTALDLRDSSGRNLKENKSRRSSAQKDTDYERRRRDPDREWRKRDSVHGRRRESDRGRRKRESILERSQGKIKQPKPKRESESEDVDEKRRRKRSVSPCEDSDRSKKEKRRPSPSEMVKTLNGYETDLLQAMDKVKGKYMKKQGNETSSSRGSSLDSMTPGLAEFNCLLKHISCLRKELKKYSKGDVG